MNKIVELTWVCGERGLWESIDGFICCGNWSVAWGVVRETIEEN